MNRISSACFSTLALAAVLLTGASGCNSKSVDDPTLTAQVQQRIAGDNALANEPVQVMAQAGVVTLTGAVSSAAARSLAANDAAAMPGVQKVVNDITVSAATGPATAMATPPLQQPQPMPVPAPRERVRTPVAPPTPAPITRSSAAPMPPPYQPPVQQPVRPPIAAQPVARVVTLPAGSTLPVRVTQTLDSATTQTGDSFSGAVAVDVVQDGMLLIPRGSTITGRVVEVHEAAHFKGSSLLTVELTGVNAKGQRISLSTEPYSVQGKGRGKNTAVKTGIGAAAGAVLGGIFGGGKGAAIGAAAGGGTGAAINGVTRGDQVQILSESVVRFVTTNSIAVRTTTHAGANSGEPELQNRQ